MKKFFATLEHITDNILPLLQQFEVLKEYIQRKNNTFLEQVTYDIYAKKDLITDIKAIMKCPIIVILPTNS